MTENNMGSEVYTSLLFVRISDGINDLILNNDEVILFVVITSYSKSQSPKLPDLLQNKFMLNNDQ